MEHMVITVRGVCKSFGATQAVNTIDFSIKKGEIVGFVGANGAGKSTTITMLLGFIAPTQGTIKLFDEPVTPVSAYKQHHRIGYAAGDMELPTHLSGRQYLRFVTSYASRDTARRYEELMHIFQPELDKKIAELSRGNKQKIALMAALVTSPDLIILDEPTSGLDPIMQEKFLNLIKQEQARGATVFMSSHYLNEIADVCTRVILMRKGAIIRDSAASELFQKSGKRVRIVSAYGRTQAPRGADEPIVSKDVNGHTVVEFGWKNDPATLQQWLAGVKQLQDIEVTEFDVEAAFKDMYDEDEAL